MGMGHWGGHEAITKLVMVAQFCEHIKTIELYALYGCIVQYVNYHLIKLGVFLKGRFKG